MRVLKQLATQEVLTTVSLLRGKGVCRKFLNKLNNHKGLKVYESSENYGFVLDGNLHLLPKGQL